MLGQRHLPPLAITRSCGCHVGVVRAEGASLGLPGREGREGTLPDRRSVARSVIKSLPLGTCLGSTSGTRPLISSASSIHHLFTHLPGQQQERHRDTRQPIVAHPLPRPPHTSASPQPNQISLHVPSDKTGHETRWTILTTISFLPVLAPGTVAFASTCPAIPCTIIGVPAKVRERAAPPLASPALTRRICARSVLTHAQISCPAC